MNVEETRLRVTVVHEQHDAELVVDAVRSSIGAAGVDAIVKVESWTRPLDGDEKSWRPTAERP